MKIVQINICFRYGSTGKIVAAIHDELLLRGHDSFVIYSIANDIVEQNTYPISNRFKTKWWGRFARLLGLRFECAFGETYKVTRLLDQIKPDIVHIHCLNNYYINPRILFRYLSKTRTKVLITNHADINFTANCDCAFECIKWKTGCGNCPNGRGNFHSHIFDFTAISWNTFKKGLQSIENLHYSSVSKYTHLRAMESPFFKYAKSSRIICNGVDTRLFQNNNLRGTSDKKIVLHVTPNIFDQNKGFKYVISLARINPSLIFFVVGANCYKDAPLNVIFKSKITNPQILVDYYSTADVTLLTSKQESFSLVCAESLCCGTPVVGFKAGAPETIAIKEYSSFVEYGNIEALNISLHNHLKLKVDHSIISKTASEEYGIDKMSSSYIDYYFDIIAQ